MVYSPIFIHKKQSNFFPFSLRGWSWRVNPLGLQGRERVRESPQSSPAFKFQQWQKLPHSQISLNCPIWGWQVWLFGKIGTANCCNPFQKCKFAYLNQMIMRESNQFHFQVTTIKFQAVLHHLNSLAIWCLVVKNDRQLTSDILMCTYISFQKHGVNQHMTCK